MMRASTRQERLVRRAELLRRARDFFYARDYVEIDAPILVRGPTVDPNIDSFALENQTLFLSTSPEFQLKRLVAEGFSRVYSLGHVFRRGESGPHHNPEFMMLEWYRVGASWREVAEEVIALIAELAGPERSDWHIDRWRWRSVAQLFAAHAQIELTGGESAAELATKISAAGHRTAQSGRWDDLFFTVFLDVIEPALQTQPTVVYDWPVELASLARRKADDPDWVERFELYAGGLELCNGFGELTDPEEQRVRFATDNQKRALEGKQILPVDEKFLAAVGELPPVSGVAVGFDRLYMLLARNDDIRAVLPFPFDEL